MNDTLIDAIQTFTLQARADLEREAQEQLEGLYGWLPDGSFAPEGRYPALGLDEARETRARLEQYARDETEAGFDAVKSRSKLIREAAFTWLNRFVAFKMLENRRVLKTLVTTPESANAYKFWLADGHDPDADRLHQDGDTPVNAMGEGPRQIAYRRFLLWQCGELAREMSILFDPSTLASRLCPRPIALRSLVNSLNSENIADAWVSGNEETIGWVYQGFNKDDKATVFASFQKGKKITADMIGAATQIFTPRWVVQYLVENSLGHLWMEMHPDSTLKDSLAYFVPHVGDPLKRPLKPVKKILFLDPSCGSMHFGIVAFDIFAEMYREEIARAGQPDWPEKPSVATAAEIPSAIVANNLHGIDLDPRAVQISALTLLIKARGLNSKAVVTDRNLACCNVEAITGGRLEAIIEGAKFDQPVYERILRAMTIRLKDSNNLGSLLRPERDLEQLIDEEREKLNRSAGLLPGLGESDLFSLDTQEKKDIFFTGLAFIIARQLDDFVRQSRTAGKDEGHFVGETAKGLNFLRLVQQRYDVVATNPPYLDSRDYNAIHKAYLESAFPSAKRNLFAAFIQRCLELTAPQSYVGMITGQSFMFISTYENLREKIFMDGFITTLTQYDYNLFRERVDTAAFVIRREADANPQKACLGVYFRLVKERDAEAKRYTFVSALAAYRAGKSHPQVFIYKQTDFAAIPGKPWVYWIPSVLRDMFAVLPTTSDQAPVKEGINTGDNFRFMRHWWEVEVKQVGPSKKWCRFAKGNRSIPYVNRSSYVVRNNIKEMRSLSGSRIFNEDYFFHPAVGFLSNSSTGFCAWMTEAGHMFCSTGGRSVFPIEEDMHFFVGLLNTTVFKSLVDLINPTISYKAGDVSVVPIPKQLSQTLNHLVTQCMELAGQESRESETAYDFIVPLRKVENRADRQARLHALETEIDIEISRLYGLSQEDLAAIDRELNNAPITEHDEEGDLTGEEDNEVVEVLELSQAEISRQWISYAIGIVIGRFEIGKPSGFGCGDFPQSVASEILKLVDNDGIMPCEAGNPQDIAARALDCLNLMLGADSARAAIRGALGDGDSLDVLRAWLDRFTGQPAQSLWRYHFQMYRKRPVYWPFQSPGRKYTVWVFHEKFGPDTLFRIRNEFVEPRLRLVERKLADLRVRAVKDRQAAKELDRMLDLADDLTKFSASLKAITERGYTPHIDDGVLLNAAPLYEVLPSWPDTKTAWKELEEGKYDWAHQAMAYWPDRVKAACLTNKSFAIAHGLAVPESEGPVTAGSKRQRRKKKAP